jgi:hypothetical protein
VGQCEVARRVVISQSSVRRTANEKKFPPYHIALIQVLKETDFSQRLNYCRFVWQQIILDDNFLENVLFRDEACFSNRGDVNKHNCHYYAQNNPRRIREGHFQTVDSTNVWCEILGNKIIGRHFFAKD